MRGFFSVFFYAPGSHHPLTVRTSFYDVFSTTASKYLSLGKVFLVGDTNARLGPFLNDRNVHGQLTTNLNKTLFLEFLEYTGLVVLNKLYSEGVPTYEIVNRKRSIIDLCLTSSPESVVDFKVEPKPFGVNCQTCHRALSTTISIRLSARVPATAIPRRTFFGRITAAKRNKITSYVVDSIVALNARGFSYDYQTLTRMFFSAKRIFLGLRTSRQKPAFLSPAMRDLQRRYSIEYFE